MPLEKVEQLYVFNNKCLLNIAYAQYKLHEVLINSWKLSNHTNVKLSLYTNVNHTGAVMNWNLGIYYQVMTL